MNPDVRSKLSEYAIKRLLTGDGLNAHGITVRVDWVHAEGARVSMLLTDRSGKELAQIAAATLAVGSTMTVLELDRAFNITVSGE